jgi:hypothetical protein
MKTALTALMAVVALAATYDLQAQQEPASARALSGDPARGPVAFRPTGTSWLLEPTASACNLGTPHRAT